MAVESETSSPATQKKSWIGRLMYLALGVAVLVVASLAFLSWSGGNTPPNLGATNGQLSLLPDKPNCVSTQTDDESKKMEPLPMQRTADGYDLETTMSSIKSILADIGSNSIVSESKNYLHVTFQSRLFRFTDDVEFLADPETGFVHFRSGSRSGHSDMGVNRKRMELISTQYLQAVQP